MKCLFCDTAESSRSKEHVLPSWLEEYLQIDSNIITPAHYDACGEVQSRRQLSVNNLVEGRICNVCNNGWMSQLEDDTREILIPLIEGEAEVIELSSIEKLSLSKWAIKTAYVLNSSSNYSNKIPKEHYHSFFKDRDNILENLFVVAQQHHGTSKFYWLQSLTWKVVFENGTATEYHTENLKSKSYKVSMQLGKLLITVSYLPYNYKYLLWRGVHIPLWPQKGSVGWYENSNEFPWYDSLQAITMFHVSSMCSCKV